MFERLLILGLVQSLAFLAVALGVAILFKAQRFFNFSFGAIYAVGAYTAYWLCVHNGVPLAVAAVLGAGVATVFGLLTDSLIFSPLRKRGASAAVQMIASIGLYVAAVNVISMLFGDDIRSLQTWPVKEGFAFLSVRISGTQIIIGLSSLMLTVAVACLLKFSAFGLALRAVSMNEALALSTGIRTRRVVLLGVVLGSAVSGLAGVLLALDTGLVPTMGFRALLIGIVVGIVGGMGRIRGAVVGSILLGLTMYLGILLTSTKWQDATAFLLLLVFLLFRPKGIFGSDMRLGIKPTTR